MAKKANSAFEGTPIQIKRTELSVFNEDDIKVIDADGNLKFGEPIYFDKEKYFAIGTADNTKKINDLKIFKAVPKNLAEGILFYNQQLRNSSSDKQRVQFIDESGQEIYAKFRIFTTRNSSGESVNIKNTSQKIKVPAWADNTWYPVDSKTGKIDKSKYAGKEDFPKAIEIALTGMTSDTVPFISLALTNTEQGSKSSTKAAKKAFGNITAVESDNNKLIVYCGYKNLDRDCYMDVFGG